MVGDGQVLLHFIELARQHRVEGVFLTVHGLGFQRREQLGEGQGNGIGAQGLEAVQEDVVLHHAQLHVLQIFQLGDGALVVGQVAKAVFPIDQTDHALGLQSGLDLLSHGAVQHGIGLLGVGKQKWSVPDRHLGRQAHQRGGGADHHLLGAADQGLLHLRVRAQGGVADGADLHLAAAGLFHFLGEHAHGTTLVGIFHQAVAEPHQAGLEVLCLNGTCGQQHCRESCDCKFDTHTRLLACLGLGPLMKLELSWCA